MAKLLDNVDPPKRFDFAPSSNLLGSASGERATRGVGEGESKSRAERVLYETRQKMHSIRDTLAGHGPGGFPEPGELVRLTTFSDINALTILVRGVEVFGEIDAMIAAYSINQRAIFALRKMLETGDVARALVLGSDTITWRDPARIREMWETARLFPESVEFGMAKNHAKVLAFRPVAGGRDRPHIVVTGSANLASNSRIEDYAMTNSVDGWDHYEEWMREMIEPLPDPATLKDKDT